VFIPKYRRKILYGNIKRDLAEILRKLCEMKKVVLVEGKICKDHIHMYLSIPPKLSVSEFMGYLKGKSALMIFYRHLEKTSRWDRHFWAKGYYVATVGNVNEATILEYIRNQEDKDKQEDGLE
jgi:putative transposase